MFWQSYKVNSDLIFSLAFDFNLWFSLYMLIHHDKYLQLINQREKCILKESQK